MDLLKSRGATLCMVESQAASVLCQAVFDGDSTLLRRLLEAGVPPSSADYDKRTGTFSQLRIILALSMMKQHTHTNKKFLFVYI